MDIPTGVHILLEREGKVLLQRRAGTGFFDGLFSLPGGHVEEGESLLETARREAREELDIDLALGALTLFGAVHRRSDTHRVDFFVRAGAWQGEPRIAEPGKCDRLVWAAPSALPVETVPYIRAALGQSRGPWILEFGW
ncbi:MAG: NUDIX domain-containing protein [Zoogloeaceae bacterium]|nr:NUDIX domain-containing protein [Zoogloeaceae bacterium]